MESVLLLVSGLSALVLVALRDRSQEADAAQLQTFGLLLIGWYDLAFQMALVVLGAGSLLQQAPIWVLSSNGYCWPSQIVVSGEGWCECGEVRGPGGGVPESLLPGIQAYQVDGDCRGDVLEMRTRETDVPCAA